MATMFFGQYLLASGAIDRKALLDALDRQRRSNFSLPELAVQQGLIDRGRADAVLAKYRMSDLPMERILVEVGGLRGSDVDRLQHRQRSSWLRIGAALVEAGSLSEDELAVRLDEFRSLASATDQQIRRAMSHLPDSEAVSACVELTVFHFERVSGRPAKLDSVSVEEDRLEIGFERFSQRIVGDGDFTIAVDLPAELASAVARGMLGFAVDPGTETEADAVCEFINLIGGNACTRIEQLGRVLRPEPPVWSRPGEVELSSSPGVHASVISEDSGFVVRVFSDAGGGS